MKVLLVLLVLAAKCKPFQRQTIYQKRIANADSTLPVVFWHGMGDTATSSGMTKLAEIIKKTYPGIYVKSLSFGGKIEDFISGYYPDANTLVSRALSEIESDSNLVGGYIGIGLSQGAQLLRAVAQRHSFPMMKKLISLGGQHQGVFGLPNCNPTYFLCKIMADSLSKSIYTVLQNSSVQAGYWHDPSKEELYVSNSLFLADINQERVINQKYKKNIMNMVKFVMVKFTKDKMVYPSESSHFGFYEKNNLKRVLSMEETDLYKEDRLGLKYLNERNGIKFLEVEGNHLQFTQKWFEENIVPLISNDD